MATPKLRFKEFDGDWANFNLGDISDIKTGPFGSTLHQKDYVEIGTPIITVEHLGEVGLTSQNLPLVSDEDKVRLKSYMLDEGDLAFSRVGSVDRCAIITDKEKGWLFSGRILRVRPNKKLVHSKNLMYALKTEDAKYRIRSVAVGQTMPSLNTEILKNFSINLSNSVEEQTKIASFLAAVDEKITQLTQKHQLLSQYKQGMMQKLFSQQIRFKADDGSEFGEWDEYSLDTLLSKIIDNRGKTPVTEANLEIPLIEVNAIGQRRIKYEKVSKYFSEDTFQNWFRAYLEHQDILFSTVGNTAICSIYTDEIKAGIAQNIVGLRANTKLIQPTFLYYLLTEISNNQKFKSIEMQAVQPSIKVSQMIHLTFLTPCLEEQTKIANFLSSIDQKIEVTAQQIEQAKLWKKGLLQQMFV